MRNFSLRNFSQRLHIAYKGVVLSVFFQQSYNVSNEPWRFILVAIDGEGGIVVDVLHVGIGENHLPYVWREDIVSTRYRKAYQTVLLHTLRNPFVILLRYIHQNPDIAGLARPHDYSFYLLLFPL